MFSWFGNLPMRSKMMLGFGIVTLVTVVAALCTGYAVKQVQENLRIVYEDYTAAGTDLAHAAVGVLKYRNNMMLLATTDQLSTIKPKLEEQAAVREKIMSSLEAYAATELRVSSSGRNERQDLQTLRDLLKQYFEITDVTKQYLLEAVAAPTSTQATAALIKARENIAKNGGPKLVAVMGALDELITTVRDVAKDMNDNGTTSSHMALWVLAIGALTGAAIGIFFGAATSKIVSTSLSNVLEAAKKIGGGVLSARSSVTYRDEVGELSKVFNEMGASMEAASTKQQEMMEGAKAQAAEIKGITDAIDKAQASIEFKLDGTIMTANENFLKTVGYSLQEIKGQHHRMFCDPAYTSSGEYVGFWQKLNRGEFDAGVYKRLGKGGKEIWIQASYNPIVDAAGKVYKVVKFATDITAQKKAQFEMEALVQEAQTVLGRLADNDLTQSMGGSYQGELEKIKQSINAVVHNLTDTMTTVKEAVGSVSTGAEEITKGNEDLAQRTSEQASALEETSASMEEMTSTVKQNADNAKQANQLAIAARDIADKGGSITSKAVDAMGEINKSSKKIADIITVIDEIAFQTNLLALNAAVEAARAGEHGRGFAVVAAEVRNLAQRSATAAKEIKGLINESIQRVNDGSELVNQSGKTLDEIVNSVKRVTDIIAEITAASQEQAQGIDQVNKAIMQMDETTQQNAALVEETTSASQSMKEQAKELARQVEGFKVASGGSSAPTSAARPVSKPMSGAKPMAKKPSAAPKAAPKPVAASSSRASDDFEEF